MGSASHCGEYVRVVESVSLDEGESVRKRLMGKGFWLLEPASILVARK